MLAISTIYTYVFICPAAAISSSCLPWVALFMAASVGSCKVKGNTKSKTRTGTINADDVQKALWKTCLKMLVAGATTTWSTWGQLAAFSQPQNARAAENRQRSQPFVAVTQLEVITC